MMIRKTRPIRFVRYTGQNRFRAIVVVCFRRHTFPARHSPRIADPSPAGVLVSETRASHFLNYHPQRNFMWWPQFVAVINVLRVSNFNWTAPSVLGAAVSLVSKTPVPPADAIIRGGARRHDAEGRPRPVGDLACYCLFKCRGAGEARLPPHLPRCCMTGFALPLRQDSIKSGCNLLHVKRVEILFNPYRLFMVS